MCFLYAMGNLARIFTSLIEVNDKIVLMNYTISFIINGTLTGQIVIYWKNTHDSLQGQKQEYE